MAAEGHDLCFLCRIIRYMWPGGIGTGAGGHTEAMQGKEHEIPLTTHGKRAFTQDEGRQTAFA